MRNNRKQFLSSDVLKMIALITMLLDHIGAALILQALSFVGADGYDAWYIFYRILRNVGRTSFPLYAFLLVEGFFYTRSRRKYLERLALFALLSEMPYDLAFRGTLFYGGSQNIFLTLAIGFLVLWGLEKLRESRLTGLEQRADRGRYWIWLSTLAAAVLLILTGMIAAEMLHTDYGRYGVLLLVLFYLRKRWNVSQIYPCVGGYLLFLWEPYCFVGFLLLLFYNGKRKPQGKGAQYFFYLFYPVHLLILGLLRVVFFSG